MPKYIKQKLTELKGVINSNTLTLGDFNAPLFTMDQSSKQGINEETVDLNNTIDQMYLTDVHRTFYPTTAECTFFSSTHKIFCRTDHMLGTKTSHSKFKKTEII